MPKSVGPAWRQRYEPPEFGLWFMDVYGIYLAQSVRCKIELSPVRCYVFKAETWTLTRAHPTGVCLTRVQVAGIDAKDINLWPPTF